jgi:hypothetical protein
LPSGWPRPPRWRPTECRDLLDDLAQITDPRQGLEIDSPNGIVEQRFCESSGAVDGGPLSGFGAGIRHDPQRFRNLWACLGDELSAWCRRRPDPPLAGLMSRLAGTIDGVIGVGTHRDTLAAAVTDPVGGVLAQLSVSADAAGYQRLIGFARA